MPFGYVSDKRQTPPRERISSSGAETFRMYGTVCATGRRGATFDVAPQSRLAPAGQAAGADTFSR
jgi:hypothetical protein